MITNPCPTCGAEPGQPCMIVHPTADWSYEGRPYRKPFFHEARTTAPDITDEDLARRACLVLRQTMRDAARYFSRVDFGELNRVMVEAERRGWFRDE